jgi:hypothetical protein
MVTFTIITGIATLVSLFLQVQGLVPKHKKLMSQVWVFFAGMTLGLLCNTVSSISFTFPYFRTSTKRFFWIWGLTKRCQVSFR